MASFTCRLCPRQCGAVRSTKNPDGFCHMPADPAVARAALHFGEEPCISGDPQKAGGSGTVFFSGCTLGCLFCQNREISHERFGQVISVERLADIFRELVDKGAHNINLVNPTHYAVAIRQALERYRPPVPVVYNTGGYERVETLRSLEGLIDVYLPDCKYVHSDISEKLSGAADYFTFASTAIQEMVRQTGPMRLAEDGIAQSGTLVRHLVLPGHIHESMAVLDFLADALPKGTWVSLMFQYTPIRELPFKELNRRLTARECEKIGDYMLEKGLIDGYIQQRGSAKKSYIPLFDLTGVNG